MPNQLYQHNLDLKHINITDQEKHKLLHQLRVLDEYCDRSETLNQGEIDCLKMALPHLIGLLPLKIDPIGNFGQPFERMVINEMVCKLNKRLNSLTQLRYPPLEIAHSLDYNRVSLKGQSMFYAGTMGKLSNAIEIKPKQGQLITISKWQFNRGEVLNMIVLCQDRDIAFANHEVLLDDYNNYWKVLHSLQDNTREVVEATYRFIMKAFTRQVSPSNRQGYLPSALIANMILSHSKYGVDAIYYPSVANKGSGMNIAIKPKALDTKFTMIEASESVVLNHPNSDFPGWGMHRTGTCVNYDRESLLLDWQNESISDEGPARTIMKRFNVDLT